MSADRAAPSTTAGEVLAEARDLVLRYGSHTALAASTFTIPFEGVTAVIGPNGSGKSTLLHALGGLVPVAEGTLSVLGEDPRAVRSQIGYVLQSTWVPSSTPITVKETVGMGRYPSVGFFRPFGKRDRERVAKAMRRLKIDDLADRHLHELSGGQRQRVYVAQGICQDHRVLLLDEPLTGLDLVSARAIDDLIHSERSRGHSVVLTTHDLDEARAADFVILVSGRVIAAGPPAVVCTRRNLEVAFGLGSLHGWEGFVNDPAHDPHHDAHQA
jgi:iron complex transport system ATP-binding protein